MSQPELLQSTPGGSREFDEREFEELKRKNEETEREKEALEREKEDLKRKVEAMQNAKMQTACCRLS